MSEQFRTIMSTGLAKSGDHEQWDPFSAITALIVSRSARVVPRPRRSSTSGSRGTCQPIWQLAWGRTYSHAELSALRRRIQMRLVVACSPMIPLSLRVSARPSTGIRSRVAMQGADEAFCAYKIRRPVPAS